MTMNLLDIVEAVAMRCGLPKRKAQEVVEETLSAIHDGLLAGETVNFNGFGKFITHTREAREARNPRTGAKVKVPDRTTVKFKPGITLLSSFNDTAA